MDVWNGQDARWRHFVHGKPMPIQEHPESILWNYLSAPRDDAPRWYLEGGAVFFETWMSGGLGRAQGGYDEMVWRAKVRDNDRFYSPLGLESEGTAVDFQVGVNDYLYGTRFMSYLALKYGPEKFVEWQSRREGSKAFYAAQFRHVFGRRLDDVWNDWIAFEHDYQKANLAKLAQYPLTETVKLSPRGLGSMSRGFVDAKTNSLIAAFRYPGTIGFVGRMDLATGKLTKLQEIKGMMLYKVTSLAFDPDAANGLLHRGQLRLPRPHRGQRRHRPQAHAAARRAHRRPGRSIRRQVDLGHPPRERPCDHRPHSGALCRLQPDPHASNTARSRSTSTSRPTGQLLSASFGEINGKQSVRVWKIAGLIADSDPEEVARLDAAAVDARGLHLRARRQVAVRHRPITPASRTSSASTSRRRNMTRSATPRPASSGRCRSPTAR